MRNIVALAGDTATASPNTKTAMIKIAAGNTLVTDAMVIVTPNPLDFVDFQAGHSYRQRVQLRNVSPVIQRLRIEPPRTHHFRIVRNRIASDSFEALTLVPGFDATIEVEFVAPEERRRPRPAELLSPAIGSPKELTVYPADRAVAVEQGPVIDDRIAVHVHGIPEPLLIPLRASAAVAQIEAPDGVDFGVVKALKQRPVSASLTLAKGTVRGASAGGANGGLIRAAGGSAHSTGSSNRSAGGPASASSSPASARFRHVTSVSKTINIVNTGAKDVCVELLHDKAHPLRVTPSRVTLAAGSSQKVRLDFVPVKAGPFKSELVLREVAAIATSVVSTPRKAIGSLTSLLSSGMDGNGEAHGADPFNLDESSPGVIKTIGLSATVVDRQLQFCDVDGTCELEFNSLDFGTIYAGDQCVIRTRLRNRGSAAVRWVCQRVESVVPLFYSCSTSSSSSASFSTSSPSFSSFSSSSSTSPLSSSSTDHSGLGSNQAKDIASRSGYAGRPKGRDCLAVRGCSPAAFRLSG